MHRCIDQSSIAVESSDISRPVIPVHAQRVDGRVGVAAVDMQKLHDPAQVVWVAGGLAYEIHVI